MVTPVRNDRSMPLSLPRVDDDEAGFSLRPPVAVRHRGSPPPGSVIRRRSGGC